MSTTEKVEETAVPAEAETTGLQFDREILLAQQRLQSESRRLAAAAAALGPLTRAATYVDLKKLRAAVEKVEEKLPAEARDEAGVTELLDRIRSWIDEASLTVVLYFHPR